MALESTDIQLRLAEIKRANDALTMGKIIVEGSMTGGLISDQAFIKAQNRALAKGQAAYELTVIDPHKTPMSAQPAVRKVMFNSDLRLVGLVVESFITTSREATTGISYSGYVQPEDQVLHHLDVMAEYLKTTMPAAFRSAK